MKRLVGCMMFSVLLAFPGLSIGRDDASSQGVLEDIKIDRFIKQYYPDDDLTENEVVNAVYMYNSILADNNNKPLVDVLRRIVSQKTLPKGAWIRLWRDEKKSHEMWILELNRNKQPNDVAPEPGSVDLIVRIPLRVNHSKELMR